MRLAVDWRTSLSLVGTVLKWLSVPLLLPIGVAVLAGEPVAPFLAAVAIAVGGGLGLETAFEQGDLDGRAAFLMVALVWLAIAVVGAIPFVVAGQGSLAHPVNALFESMSGVTTTGATVIVDFSAHGRAILLWRAVLQWLGGLGILVLATAVLATLGVGGAQLMETESQTRSVNKLTPSIRQTARLLWGVYGGLTVLAILVLYGLHLVGLAPTMTLYDAVAHAFTSVSTSGFSPRGESIGAFAPAVQWALIPFMIVGATNFVLLYHVIGGDVERLRRSEEFRFYLLVLGGLAATVAALLALDPATTYGPLTTVRHALFQVVSIVTTTGYATVDYNAWSPAAKHVLFAGMFLGGMAGSTTCSIKLVRWLVVVKAFRRDLFTAVHPEAIRPVRLSGSPVGEETVRDVYAYTLVSLLVFFAATVFVVADAARVGLAIGEFEAMGAAASTFLNIGPAFGLAGPFGSYAGFPTSTRLVMTFLMWLGRLELVPVLVLLTPTFWR